MNSTVVLTSALTSTVVSGLTTVVMKYYFDRRLVAFTADSGRIHDYIRERNEALKGIGSQVYRFRNSARAFINGSRTFDDSVKDLEGELAGLRELLFKNRILLSYSLYEPAHRFEHDIRDFIPLVKAMNRRAAEGGIDPKSQTMRDLPTDPVAYRQG